MRHRVTLLACLALLLLTLSGCGSVSAQSPLPTTPTPPPLPTFRATATLAATATPRPTNTPQPTATQPPTATPQPTPYGGGRPVTLSIPAIGIEGANVVQVGLEPNGAMEAPQGWWDVGWFQYGPLPGLPGNAVMSGHVDSDHDDQAIFRNLSRVKRGDRIIVGMADGTARSFIVQSTEVYPFDRSPIDRIFGSDSVPRLNLITCEGNFNRSSKNYDRRLVVYTTLEVEG